MCTVSWCDQGNRPHETHEWTIATHLGHNRPKPGNLDRHARSVQLVAFGKFTPQIMLAIVDGDTHEQAEIVIGWDELLDLLEQAVEARGRLQELERDRRVEFIPEPDAVPPF